MAAGRAPARTLLLGLLVLRVLECAAIHAGSDLLDDFGEESSAGDQVAAAVASRRESRIRSQIGLHAASLQLAREADDEDDAWEAFVHLAEEGKALEEGTDCDQLPEHMANALGAVSQVLAEWLGGGAFATLDVDAIIAGQEMVIAVAAVADRKTCLPLVMGSEDVQQKLGEVLSIAPKVVGATPSEGGKAIIREALVALVSFQEGMLLLSASFADRHLLLDIEDIVEQCPSPCRKCDHEASAAFGFRCILDSADKDSVPSLPARHGVTCAPPRRRSGVAWFSWWGSSHSRQCHVADWKEAAAQHVHISAALACAATLMLTSLSATLTQAERRTMHRHCMALEHGGALKQDQQDWYITQSSKNHGLVPNSVKLALNAILASGLATGLAGLRAATRGNERRASSSTWATLLEESGLEEPAAFSAHFAQALVEEGLEVSAADRAMFGARSLLTRSDTLQKLEECDEVYNLKSQNSFAEGALPLSDAAIMIRQASGVGSRKVVPWVWRDAGSLILGAMTGYLITRVWYIAATQASAAGFTSNKTLDVAWTMSSVLLAYFFMDKFWGDPAKLWWMPIQSPAHRIEECMKAASLNLESEVDNYHQECWTNGGCVDNGASICIWCGLHAGSPMNCCRQGVGHHCHDVTFAPLAGHRCVTKAASADFGVT